MFFEANVDGESVVPLPDTSMSYTSGVARKRLKHPCCSSQNL